MNNTSMSSALSPTQDEDRRGDWNPDILLRLLSDLSVRLGVENENWMIQQAVREAFFDPDRQGDRDSRLMRAANSLGIRLGPADLKMESLWQLLLDGNVVALLSQQGNETTAVIIAGPWLGRVDCTVIDSNGLSHRSLTRSKVASFLKRLGPGKYFVTEPLLRCQSMSRSKSEHDHHDPHESPRPHSGHHADHHRLSPLRRVLRLLRFEFRDIWSLMIFGFVAAILDLATPLAVEQMVTTIGFASLTQPLIWLAVLLFSILALSALIRGLQIFVIEILQRRLFVRIVGDLSERLARTQRSALDGTHGPELANRFFDVMTIQKSISALLIEGLSLVIQTLTGLLLLALYSPFLLAFDIALIMSMTLILYMLGRNAVRTAIDESIIKYRVAHWLQDIIGNPTAFQLHSGGDLAVDRANRLTVDYLNARRKHFVVLIRQILFALLLYAVSISTLLSLGVWLVLSNQLSMGQLVASVSVVVIVVGGFSKIGKSLETFYDMLAGMDKIGHLIDLPTTPRSRIINSGKGPVDIRFKSLELASGDQVYHVEDLTIERGKRFAVCGEGRCGKSILLQSVCGLRLPHSGHIEIDGIDSRDVNRAMDGALISFAGTPEIFHGGLLENVSLNRLTIGTEEVRSALQIVEMWDEALGMQNGLETQLQSGGYPLSESQAIRLMIARAIVSKPRLLILDGILDRLPPGLKSRIWDRLRDQQNPWTLILSTNDPVLLGQCDGKLDLSLSNKVNETSHKNTRRESH